MAKPYKARMRKALKSALKKAGSPAKLGKIAGVSRQAVNKWDTCPPEHVLKIEAATGVSRHDLRPDIYPVT